MLWEWSVGEKKDSFDYAIGMFPCARTVDENVTHGIQCDDTSPHTCSIRISSITFAANVAQLCIIIYDGSSVVLEKAWSDFSSFPTSWEPFTLSAGKKYSIQIEIAISPDAVGSSAIAIDLRTD